MTSSWQWLGIEAIPCRSVGTVIHIAIDGKYSGHILISDVEKPDAKDAIAALKRAGVSRPSCSPATLTGVAQYTAKNLGVDEVYSELLPGGKVDKVEMLLSSSKAAASSPSSATASTTPVLSR